MPLIGQRERAQIKEWFDRSLNHDLSIIHFTNRTHHEPLLVVPGSERHYYQETCDLLEEIASLSQKIRLEIYDFEADAKAAEEYHIDKIPATVLMGAQDYGVRYFGIPSGYEFSTFIQAIIDVSKGIGGLSQETSEQLQKVNQETHIQVLVTPGWPVSPKVASLAYKLAIENAYVKVDVIELAEFPRLALKYGVMGVPLTIVNETVRIRGDISENTFLEHIVSTMKESPESPDEPSSNPGISAAPGVPRG